MNQSSKEIQTRGAWTYGFTNLRIYGNAGQGIMESRN